MSRRATHRAERLTVAQRALLQAAMRKYVEDAGRGEAALPSGVPLSEAERLEAILNMAEEIEVA